MRELFTIPDPDLIQESSIDPMGLQVIWTRYGQDMFGDKLTTIANDLRIFTFNLFHNHLINRLYKDCIEEIQSAKSYYKSWQTEFDVKAGLLIFLEDLVAHVFHLTDDNDPEVDKIGIIGLNKASITYNSYTHDKIYLAANKRLGLLKSQLNLGMTGRYKGPMMNMLFFDRSLTYIPKTWELVDRFMYKWVDAMILQESIIKLIIKHLFESPYREYPRLTIQEIKSTRLWKPISEGYLKCFGSGKMQPEIKAYWKDRLGLTAGAPNALYKVFERHKPQDIDHKKILTEAKTFLNHEPTELKKIDTVLTLEPFLSHAEYLIRYLSQPGVKTFKVEEENISLLRTEIISASNFLFENELPRLKELKVVMLTQGSLDKWLLNLLAFHKKILEKRGGNRWIDLDEKGNIRHYFTPALQEQINTVTKYLAVQPWLHTYYLETLQSIYRGLN